MLVYLTRNHFPTSKNILLLLYQLCPGKNFIKSLLILKYSFVKIPVSMNMNINIHLLASKVLTWIQIYVYVISFSTDFYCGKVIFSADFQLSVLQLKSMILLFIFGCEQGEIAVIFLILFRCRYFQISKWYFLWNKTIKAWAIWFHQYWLSELYLQLNNL